MKQHIIIITGMHRSGTSLVASVLQEAGVNIGEKLLGPSQGNLLGHFEDIDFFQFHEKLLHRFGQTLFVQEPIPLEEITPAEIEEALHLAQQRSDRLLWGWKDPRTALFLEFWHSLMPEANYIFVYRHPLEVVLSLLRRGTDLEVLTSPLTGLRAWQKYNYSLLNFYRQHPENCLMAHISTITADFERFIQRTAQKLALPLQSSNFQAVYHPENLKQMVFPLIVPTILERLIPEVMDLYSQLEAVADLPSYSPAPGKAEPVDLPTSLEQLLVSLKQPETLQEEQIASKFKIFLILFNPEAELSYQKALDKIRVDQLDYLEFLVTNLKKTAAKQDAHIAHLEQVVTTKDRHIAHLEQVVTTKDSHIAHLEQSVTDRDAEIAHLEQNMIEKDTHTADLEQLVQEWEQELAVIKGTNAWWLMSRYQMLKERLQKILRKSNNKSPAKSV